MKRRVFLGGLGLAAGWLAWRRFARRTPPPRHASPMTSSPDSLYFDLAVAMSRDGRRLALGAMNEDASSGPLALFDITRRALINSRTIDGGIGLEGSNLLEPNPSGTLLRACTNTNELTILDAESLEQVGHCALSYNDGSPGVAWLHPAPLRTRAERGLAIVAARGTHDDIDDRAIRWLATRGTGTVIGARGRDVAICTDSQQLYGVDLATGKERWSLPQPSDCGRERFLCSDDGTQLAHAFKNVLTVYDTLDATPLSRNPIDGETELSWQRGPLLAIGKRDIRVFRDGSQLARWQVQPRSMPFLLAPDLLACALSPDGSRAAISTQSGDVLLAD